MVGSAICVRISKTEDKALSRGREEGQEDSEGVGGAQEFLTNDLDHALTLPVVRGVTRALGQDLDLAVPLVKKFHRGVVAAITTKKDTAWRVICAPTTMALILLWSMT